MGVKFHNADKILVITIPVFITATLVAHFVLKQIDMLKSTSDLPDKKSSTTYLYPYFYLRAKPQNRTEVSPTTTECSTIELELPVIL